MRDPAAGGKVLIWCLIYHIIEGGNNNISSLKASVMACSVMMGKEGYLGYEKQKERA